MNSANMKTPTIDDESLAMLLDEVCAVTATGRSLTLGLADLDRAAMGTIGRAAQTVRSRMEHGQSACVAIASLSNTYHAPIRGAMQVMARTGSTQPLREAVRLIRESNERRQQMWLAIINPLLSVVVAATVLFLVVPWILVSLAEAELIKTAFSPTSLQISQAFVQHFLLAVAITISAIAGVAGMLYLWQRRASRDSDAASDEATFCRWLAMQIGEPNVPVEAGRAIETAAEVVGPHYSAAWAVAVDSVRGGAQTEGALSMPATATDQVRQCVVDLVAARRDRASVAMDLEELGELYSAESTRHRQWWIETVPKWIALILMIAVTLILIQTIVAPLFDVLSWTAPSSGGERSLSRWLAETYRC